MVVRLVQERRIAFFCVSGRGFYLKIPGLSKSFCSFLAGKASRKIGTTNHPEGVAMDIS